MEALPDCFDQSGMSGIKKLGNCMTQVHVVNVDGGNAGRLIAEG